MAWRIALPKFTKIYYVRYRLDYYIIRNILSKSNICISYVIIVNTLKKLNNLERFKSKAVLFVPSASHSLTEKQRQSASNTKCL